MSNKEYCYYQHRSSLLVVHLRWWLLMLEELDLKVEFKTEIKLAQELKKRVYQRYESIDDTMINMHGQDDVF